MNEQFGLPMSIPPELREALGSIDVDAMRSSPRMVFHVVREAILRVIEACPPRDGDENPHWDGNWELGRKIAGAWLMAGFAVLLRRQSEIRQSNPKLLGGAALPEVDQVLFREYFGLPPKGDLRSDCLAVFDRVPEIMSWAEHLVEEFAVMYADWDERLDDVNFIPRIWREGINAPIPQVRKMPLSWLTPDSFEFQFPQREGATAAVALIPVSPVGASPTAEAAGPDPGLLAQAHGRIDELERELSDLKAQLTHERNEGLSSQYRDILRTLRGRLQVLESLPRAAAAEETPEVLPDSWDALQGFAASRLGGRVVISRRAYRAVKSSVYREPRFAFEVLRMLADDYVPMRHGEPGARERCEASCKRLRVKITNTGEAVDAHRTSEMYRVNHLGKRLPLDLHVQGNSSRDPRDGFRLYFHYLEAEDEPGVVVVGHLPSHLDSTHS